MVPFRTAMCICGMRMPFEKNLIPDAVRIGWIRALPRRP